MSSSTSRRRKQHIIVHYQQGDERVSTPNIEYFAVSSFVCSIVTYTVFALRNAVAFPNNSNLVVWRSLHILYFL